MKKDKKKSCFPGSIILPLFILAVSLVFSVLFIVILLPNVYGAADSTVYMTLLLLLIVVATVSSTVGIIFYLIFKKEI